jgi:hypothetical protein
VAFDPQSAPKVDPAQSAVSGATHSGIQYSTGVNVGL